MAADRYRDNTRQTAEPSAPKRRRPRAVRAARPNRRLVVVSNRVGPIAAGKASEGGLAVALRAALENARRVVVRL